MGGSKRVATSTALQGDFLVTVRAVAVHSPYGKEPPNTCCRISVDCSPEECGKQAPHFTTAAIKSHEPRWEEEFTFKLDFPEEPEEFVLKASMFEDNENGKIPLGSCSLALPIPKTVWRGRFARRLHSKEMKNTRGPPPGAVVVEVTFLPLNAMVQLSAAAKVPQRTAARAGDDITFGEENRSTTHGNEISIQLEHGGTDVVESLPVPRSNAPTSPRAPRPKAKGSGEDAQGSPLASPRTAVRRRGIEAVADIQTIPFEVDPPEDTDLIGTLKLCISSSWGLRNADVGSVSDPYCKVKVPASQNEKGVFKTRVVDDTLEPDWDEECEFFINWHEPGPLALQFEIWDQDPGENDDLLGKCHIQMPTESCHIRYVLAVDDPKAAPRKRPKALARGFGSKEAPKMKPGLQFDLHFWLLGQDQDEDFEIEEITAEDVQARVDPVRVQAYDNRIQGLNRRLPLLEKSVAKAQAERDAVLAEFDENKHASLELEEALQHNEELKELLQNMLTRSEDITELIEENTIADDTEARLIGISPTRPPLLDEVFILREAAVWLAFGQIAEAPDFSLAHVSQLEALLRYARGESDGPTNPKTLKSPTSKTDPRRPKIRDVLPTSAKVGYNQVLDACNAMCFNCDEWRRLLSYGQEEEEDLVI